MASADLGGLGPTDGEPVFYRFSPLYHAQGFIPWLLLPLAFIALKENRTPKAAWILMPVVLLAAVFWAVTTATKPDSGGVVQMNLLFTILVVGFSLVWLLAGRIGHRNRAVTLLLAALVYFGFLGANLLTGDFGKDAMTVAAMATASIPPILLAIATASLLSSSSFGKARFLVVTGIALFVSFLVVLSAVTLLIHPSPSIRGQIGEVALAALIFSLVFLAALTPFLVLLWTSRFWRKRFECVTGIRRDASCGSRVG